MAKSITAIDAETPTLGILCLDEPASEVLALRDFDHPDNYERAILSQNVPGATVDATLSADPRLAQPFVETAKSLEAKGAKLIVSNCGYVIAYDSAVRHSVSVPVATSSLLLLPFIVQLLRESEKVGILTFDSSKLTRRHLTLAWPSMADSCISLSGLEGTPSWEEITGFGVYDPEKLFRDSSLALQRLCDDPRVAIILVECCALCSFVPRYRVQAKRPIFDAVSMTRLLIEGLSA
ncbi:hypothetical protein NKI09_20490 [Mesorhizobium sp. M0757]|uniref:hypothetical protein n=1 Tax=Mesorhizobium sp. M0757 TaxID=2956993 RepID=UPI003336AFF5